MLQICKSVFALDKAEMLSYNENHKSCDENK